jgi:4-amino-4-deoxy-L-arabinose transferase-like glycosyltransferase
MRWQNVTLAVLFVLVTLILAWRWVGFQGHDDAYYAAAALHPGALGTTHWALRYPLVLPMAAVLALFGHHLAVLALPTLAAYLAWLALTYAGARALLGWPAASLAALAGILIPEFPVQATYANPDTLELAFVLGAFWCHQAALRRPDRVGPLLLCGALAGLGFLTRETAAAFPLYLVLLFAIRPGMNRRGYKVIAVAWAAVVGVELAYFWARSGDPLYRLHISAAHDQIDRAAQAVQAAAHGNTLDSEGVLTTIPLLQPLAALCISQKFGPVFLLAGPATWYALRRGGLAAPARRVVADAALLALVSVLFVALATTQLYVIPRYFSVAAGAAIIPLAAAGGCLWRASARAATAWTVALAALCLPLLAVENTDPLFTVRRLVAVAATHAEPIHTDPYTANQAAIPLAFAGLTGRVTADPPTPGALVAIPEGAAAACRASRACGFKSGMDPFIPGPRWNLLDRDAAPDRIYGRLARATGLAPLLPADILRKLAQPNPPLMLYRAQ